MTVCGCIGYHDDAAVIVEHPRHGRLVVCESHAGKQQTVLGEVSA